MTSPSDDETGFDLADFLPYRLSVVTNRLSQAFARRYAQAYGLNIPEWRVLAIVGSFAPLAANDVCEKAAMDKVKVSRAVGRLERRGLLQRSSDPGDRRVQALSLTREGRAVYDGIVPMAQSLEESLTGTLSAGERQALVNALDKIDASLSCSDTGTDSQSDKA